MKSPLVRTTALMISFVLIHASFGPRAWAQTVPIANFRAPISGNASATAGSVIGLQGSGVPSVLPAISADPTVHSVLSTPEFGPLPRPQTSPLILPVPETIKVLSASPATNDAIPALPTESLLPPQAVAALEAATVDGYAVKLLTRQEGGRKQLVVLMGELHEKSEKSFAIGREVIQYFQYRGLEAADFRLTVGGRMMAHGSEHKNKSGLALLLAAEENTSYPKGRAGSLIVEAARNAVIELPHSRVDTRPVAFELEKGHKPNIAEQLAMLDLVSSNLGHFPIAVLGGLMTIFTAILLGKGFAIAFLAVSGIYYFANMIFSYLNSTTLHGYIHRHAWLRNILPLVSGLVWARNTTMASNIQSNLTNNPEIKTLLTIVGICHIPGLKQLLVERYGFKELP